MLDIEGVDNIDVVGSATAIPLPDASFDSVVTTQVFGDVYEVKKAFLECARVLKPGGYLFFTEAFMDPLHNEPYDYWRFTAHSLRQLAESVGFSVELLEARGGYRSVMAQFHIRYLIAKWNIYERRWAGAFALYAKFVGGLALWRDRHDRTEASRLYTHGYLLVARK